MTPPRDPKTGRFISKGAYIAMRYGSQESARTTIAELEQRLPINRFVRWPWQQCKTAACKLNKGHTGRHARPNGFEVDLW